MVCDATVLGHQLVPHLFERGDLSGVIILYVSLLLVLLLL